MEQLKEILKQKDKIAKGAYLDVSDTFDKGHTLKELISDGILCSEMLNIKSSKLPLERPLYVHQEQAIKKVIKGNNLVVTTGTGSGKTESFLIPIINHLTEQKQNNILTPGGVRALIIYPMNALANDQLKRMRDLLENYQYITFGAYTGETKQKYNDALAKYKRLNKQEPLSNELISREQMKKAPPHILITNYAMLEYLMIRPGDKVFFGGQDSNNWKFIVLDEAHTYTGATGIEVSMLLRRLETTLNTKEKLQYILTSATLGSSEKDNDDVVNFAKLLCCGADFDASSVVRATRKPIEPHTDVKNIHLSLYSEIKERLEKSETVKQIYTFLKAKGIDISYFDNISELLFELIRHDRNYYIIKNYLKNNPQTVYKLTKDLQLNIDDLVNFVAVASKAIKNNEPVLEARYHMFIRAIEGVYITLKPRRQLFIEPMELVPVGDVRYRAYELSVCQNCGEMFIVGYLDENNVLRQLVRGKELDDIKKEYFMLSTENFRDEESEEDEFEVAAEDDLYYLCSLCGAIDRVTSHSGKPCDCGDIYLNKVKKIIPKGKLLHKCPSCSFVNHKISVLRDFYIGQEAAASVIGSSLYEELPSYEVKREIIEIKEDDEFGPSRGTTKVNEWKNRLSKQYLVFSDSRQEAAYFASYFDSSYNNILRKGLIVEALKRNVDVIPSDGWSIDKFVRELVLLFTEYKIFNDEDEREREAWKTILYEVCNNDGRFGLEGLGILSFEFIPVEDELHDFTKEETESLQKILANTFRSKGTVWYNYKLTERDKEYFLYKAHDSYMTLLSEKKPTYIENWCSKGSKGNKRTSYIEKITGWDREKANKFLKRMWKQIFNQDDILEVCDGDKYKIKLSKFKVKNGLASRIIWYKCDKCNRITPYNIRNFCPEYMCDGKLDECNIEQVLNENHYRQLYLNLDISPLTIKEHTAQLSSETARDYQEKFIRKEINILSCSTTFEMGVDVGELETVFMKNMPPRPSNYAQRAGRAGRRTESAAYSLTFCRLSSHDLNFFREPINMIKGKIFPPKFKVENEKIIKRHIFASALSFFWKHEEPKYFKYVEDFFLDEGFTRFVSYLSSEPLDLMLFIDDFVPKGVFKNNKEWINDLIGESGVLIKAKEDFFSDINSLEESQQRLINEQLKGKNVGSAIGKIGYLISKLKKDNILTFMSRKNVIPKYGFPVDTVELLPSVDFNNKKESYHIELQRDLFIAISEYAPDSEVIADGEIYMSRYIRKVYGGSKDWTKFNYGQCPNKDCGYMNVRLYDYDDEELSMGDCSVCGEIVPKEGVFIWPEFGFIIDSKSEVATTRKPQKTYKGEIHYIGDKREKRDTNKITHIIGDHELNIYSTSNDELTVLNNSKFYVCEECGYTKIYKNKGNIFEDLEPHKNPYGKECSNIMFKRHALGHTFKTDVVQISIRDLYIPRKEAYSVLYALLEGISSYLGIERNDVSGCLHYRKGINEKFESGFIIFDNVPGGAGHVRRLGTDNLSVITGVLKESLRIVESCTCGGDEKDTACYSCLCNYYNQKHHEDLKRYNAIFWLSKMLSNQSE